MNNATTTTANATRPSRSNRQRIARMLLALVCTFAILAGTNRAAEAQAPPDPNVGAPPSEQKRAWDFLVTSGTMVPTGALSQASGLRRHGTVSSRRCRGLFLSTATGAFESNQVWLSLRVASTCASNPAECSASTCR